jgi:hypothetical protein
LQERCEEVERDNQALLDYIQDTSAKVSPSPSKKTPSSSRKSEVDKLKALNEELMRSTRDAVERAAHLQWQIEHQSISYPENSRDSSRDAVKDVQSQLEVYKLKCERLEKRVCSLARLIYLVTRLM